MQEPPGVDPFIAMDCKGGNSLEVNAPLLGHPYAMRPWLLHGGPFFITHLLRDMREGPFVEGAPRPHAGYIAILSTKSVCQDWNAEYRPPRRLAGWRANPPDR